jgi:hypothetical protein
MLSELRLDVDPEAVPDLPQPDSGEESGHDHQERSTRHALRMRATAAPSPAALSALAVDAARTEKKLTNSIRRATDAAAHFVDVITGHRQAMPVR